MQVPEGKVMYIGARKFKAGDTIPESLIPKVKEPKVPKKTDSKPKTKTEGK